MIDVATTATLRPDLLRFTLESFKPLFEQHDDWRLILNVDPIGESCSQDDVLGVARDYFDTITVNLPTKPSFPDAWKWCVSELKADLVFWLEDDWELTGEVDLQEMMHLMRTEEFLATLRLPRWPSTETFRQWNQKTISGWNGSFMELPFGHIRHCGYSNNPSLTNRRFLQWILPRLKGTYDPEKQIAGFNPDLLHWTHAWRYGVFQRPNSPATTRDVGERWRVKHNWGKGRDKTHFKTWEFHDYGQKGKE